MTTEGKSILLELFGETPEIRLIDFFMDNPLFDFTKREIIEDLGMNKRTLYRVLPKLEEEGIVVVSRKIGRAKLYRINRESLTVRYLRGIEKAHSLREAGIQGNTLLEIEGPDLRIETK